ncbi:MAG TPA: biopolymer transporter ExbD [Chthoniobacteraceae bacterium]|jgi:biopolymer transport protein ExbD
MTRRRRFEISASDGNVGFQIAPMIDVVFVIMLFFMVMAGAVKVEKELNTQLPGSAETSTSTDFVDEQVINITEAGEVSLNDEPMDTPTSRDLGLLQSTLIRLKKASDESKSPCMVTVVSEPAAKYSRTVDVLDALSVAGISNVTFTVSEEE